MKILRTSFHTTNSYRRN